MSDKLKSRKLRTVCLNSKGKVVGHLYTDALSFLQRGGLHKI